MRGGRTGLGVSTLVSGAIVAGGAARAQNTHGRWPWAADAAVAPVTAATFAARARRGDLGRAATWAALPPARGLEIIVTSPCSK